MITTAIQMAKGMFELVGILGIASGRWGVGGVFLFRADTNFGAFVLLGPAGWETDGRLSSS